MSNPEVIESELVEATEATEAPETAEAVSFSSMDDDAIAAAVAEAEETISAIIGEDFASTDDAAFSAAIDAVEDPQALGALTAALAIRHEGTTELSTRAEARAAELAALREQARSLRPVAAPSGGAPVPAAAAVAASVRGSVRPLSSLASLESQPSSIAAAKPVVHAKTTLLAPAARFHVGAELAPSDIVAAISASGANLARSGRTTRTEFLAITPDFAGAEASGHVAAAISCLPAAPDYSVAVCGSNASQFEQAFELTRGDKPEQWRPPVSSMVTPTVWDGTDKVCATDDCEPMTTEPSSTVYFCLSVRNEDQWGDPDGVAAYFARAQNGWQASANGRAWSFVKSKSVQFGSTPNPNNRPVSATFASHFGADLAYYLDTLREGDTADLVVLVSRPLLWGIATDGVLGDIGPNSAGAAETSALAMIDRLAPGATVVPMWDAPSVTGGGFFSPVATGDPNGPTFPAGAFAIFRRGDFRRRVLGELTFGFEPSDANRIRGNADIAANTSSAFLELKYQDQFRGCLSIWHELPICATGAWPGPYQAAACSVEG